MKCKTTASSALALLLFCLAGLADATGSAAVLPGTRLEVDWPNLISGQDFILTTPPPSPIHGLLLGNGDIGVSVYGPPECLTLQVGKNDIWDYRDPVNKITNRVTLPELYARFTGSNALKEPFWGGDRFTLSQAIEAAFNQPYHAPKPAGQIRLRNGALRAAPYRQRLGLWDAEVVTELGGPEAASVRTFVGYPRNLIAIHYSPSRRQSFDIELARHKDTTGTIPSGPEFGAGGRDLWLKYRFPASEPYPNGFEYVMCGRVLGGQVQVEQGSGQVVAHVNSEQPVTVLVAVQTSRDDAEPFKQAMADLQAAQELGLASLTQEHQRFWHSFWQRSFVEIQNPYLNQHWYLSLYHLACCARPGKIMPGLCGNWTWEDLTFGAGQYFWNTCTENLFYGAYSANHLEQTVPYNQTVTELLPVAQMEAREVFGMRGAKYPHCTYPHLKRNYGGFMPYDLQMGETPWAVQQLWWYYLYSQDREFLRVQGYPVLREVATFFEDFLHPAPDGKFDLYPTLSPEHWGLTCQFKYNRNCIVDLSLVKYVMRACLAASQVLDCDAARRPNWQRLADNLRDYPTADAPGGKVFVDVENAPYPYIPYHLPCPTMAIFPGDDIGLHSPRPMQELAMRTLKALHQFHPAQGYIMLPMASIRLGLDATDEFEKLTRRHRLLNGAVYTDRHSRWIWTENFGAPVVVNESILQSYTGQLRLAPVKLKGGVRFGGLRAVGAFLVSGAFRPDGEPRYVSITSEAGALCSLIKPWAGQTRVRRFPTLRMVPVSAANEVLSFETSKGGTYVIDRPDDPWEQQSIVKVTASPAQPQIPGWYRIQAPGNNFAIPPPTWGGLIATPAGAVMDSKGAPGDTAGWQRPTPPIDTARYPALEVVMHGVGNGKVRVETLGGNGGELIAGKEWNPWPATETTLRLDLPAARTIVAVAILTTTPDGKPVECHLRSVRFTAADGGALNLDLDRIAP